MIRLPILHDRYLDTLCDAHLLCDICQQVPWTTTGHWHAALICAGCAEGEPDPEDV